MTLATPTPNIAIREARGSDVNDLAPRLRSDDLEEIRALSGRPALAVLGEAFVESEKCFAVEYKGRVAALMGVVPSPHCQNPRLGVVWLLGSDDVAIFGYSMTKWARSWLRELIQGYDVLGNIVSESNVTHVRFLRRIGARIVAGHENVGSGKVTALQFVFSIEDLQEPPLV